MRYKQGKLGVASIALLGLVACDTLDQQPPEVSILAPVAETNISGIALVQVAAKDEGEVEHVDLYVRELGSSSQGTLAGSATSRTGSTSGELAPFVVSWNTQRWPNLSTVELIAIAVDDAGNKGVSKPVQVSLFNSSSPTLNYFAGFSLPTAVPTTFQVQSLKVGHASLSEVRPPDVAEKRRVLASESSLPEPTVTGKRRYATEWAWEPQNGVRGYNIYLSKTSVMGPYNKVKSQQPDGTSGLQKYSAAADDVAPEDIRFGSVSVSSSNGESALSNAQKAVFLPEQMLVSPTVGAQVSNGRPVLSWNVNPNPDVSGYLYFIYRKNPLVSSEAPVWSNPSGRSITKLSVEYPASSPPLPKGTYYWWVAGVSFNEEGRPNGFSFSDPRTFEVP